MSKKPIRLTDRIDAEAPERTPVAPPPPSLAERIAKVAPPPPDQTPAKSPPPAAKPVAPPPPAAVVENIAKPTPYVGYPERREPVGQSPSRSIEIPAHVTNPSRFAPRKRSLSKPAKAAAALMTGGLYAASATALVGLLVSEDSQNHVNPTIITVAPDKLGKTLGRLNNPTPLLQSCYLPKMFRSVGIGIVAPEALVLAETMCEFVKRTPPEHITSLTSQAARALEDGKLSWIEIKQLKHTATTYNMQLDCSLLEPELAKIPTKGKYGPVGKDIALYVAQCMPTNALAWRIAGHMWKPQPTQTPPTTEVEK